MNKQISTPLFVWALFLVLIFTIVGLGGALFHYKSEITKSKLEETTRELQEVTSALEDVEFQIEINNGLIPDSTYLSRVAQIIRSEGEAKGITPAEAVEISNIILYVWRVYDIPPSTALGLMKVESGFQKKAVSEAEAKGLTQVLESTAAPYMELFDIDSTIEDALFDPVLNTKIGLTYLHHVNMMHPELGEHYYLSSYNRGPGNVNKMIKAGKSIETQDYSVLVLSCADQYKALGIP